MAERYGYEFSSDPKERAIVGESSRGIAAFTAGWERPDAFHRVMGHGSTFLSFGGNTGGTYPEVVRTTDEVKPLRIHLEGGMRDGAHHAAMAASLKEKGCVYQWFNSTESPHGDPVATRRFPRG